MTNPVLALLAAAALSLQAPVVGPDAHTVLTASTKAMGADSLQTLHYSGSGFAFVFGQAARPGAPWPRFSASGYTRDIDYNAPASHVQFVRTALDTRGGGGTGLPIVNQTQNQFILPNAGWAQQVDIWLTPYGFLRRALTSATVVRFEVIKGKKFSVVSFTEGKYKVNGYIDEQNMVDRVETWLEHPALSDMMIEASYSGYKVFNGLAFPTRIVQSQGGFPIFDLTITEVQPNAPAVIQPPERAGGGAAGGGFAGPGAALQGIAVRSIKAADGVYYMIGGTNNSIAVEMRDYIVMIEAPQTEERSLAFIAEAKAQIPNKPIKYLINTHHHFDHSGGLRAFAAEGAIIVTHEMNKPYYEKYLTGPRTLAPDRLSQSGKRMVFETMTDKKVLTDGARTIEIHLVRGTTHSDGSVMAYLPNERLLIEGDIFDSPGPGVPALTEGPKTAANLLENVERLHLNVERLLPVHAPAIVPISDLYERAGRK